MSSRVPEAKGGAAAAGAVRSGTPRSGGTHIARSSAAMTSTVSVALAMALSMVLAAGLGGCDLVDLHRLEVASRPERANMVIGRDDPVKLHFSRDVDRGSAERAFSLASERGMVEVDIRWRGDGFEARPVATPLPGVRHTLSLDGTLTDERGLDHEMNIYLPFYFESRSVTPQLSTVHPGDGDDAAVTTTLELHFSAAMDSESVEQAFSLSPRADLEFEWNSERHSVRISPLKPWDSVTLYEWSLRSSAHSSGGTPLASRRSGSFFTQMDSLAPELASVDPVYRRGGAWSEAGNLSAHDSLQLTFSKPVDRPTLERALSLTPFHPGTIHQLREEIFVFEPAAAFDPGERYELLVSRELADLAGNAPVDETRIALYPDSPRQRVTALRSVWPGGEQEHDLVQPVGAADEIGLGVTDGTVILEIDFALPFETKAARDSLSEALVLSAVLPQSAMNPDIESLSWSADGHRIVLSYAGLAHSTEESTPAVYRLRIPPGEASAPQEAGGLGEELTIYLKTEVLNTQVMNREGD